MNAPMNARGIRFEKVDVLRGGARVVEAVTAEVPAGRVTALIGPNGAGKSSLIDALLGFAPHGGRIVFTDANGDDEAAAGRGRPRFGYVPQRFSPDPHLPLTSFEFLACAQRRRPLWLFGAGREVRERTLGLLAAVGAEQAARRPLGGLSGGELQRVLLANALLNDPEILILDEPDAGVDAGGGGLFCELLEKLRAERGFTQLMVSHNIALVMAHAAHVVLMNRRVLAAGTPARIIESAALQEAFGLHLLNLSPHACPSCPDRA